MLSVPKGLICKFYHHWAISPDLHVQVPLDISNLDVPQTQHVKNGSHLFSLLPTFTLNACFAALDMHLDEWHCPSNQWKNLSFPKRFILPKSLCLINYQIHLLLASTTIFILSYSQLPVPRFPENLSFRAYLPRAQKSDSWLKIS